MTLDFIVAFVTQPSALQEVLQNALVGIQGLGLGGAIAFIALYVLATVLLVPGTILTLGAGVVFGVGWGSVYVFIGAVLGAIAAFLIGRYLARGWVARKIADNPRFAAIDKAVAKTGFKIVLLTRLSPIFPFVLLNYAFGVTQVALKDFFFGSVGMIPATVSFVYVGSLAGSLATIHTLSGSDSSQTVRSILQVIGFIATIITTVYITRVARRALDSSISAGE
jgi:uncharacterized membrane protein YdjX (TVP38/TMEM64 family)